MAKPDLKASVPNPDTQPPTRRLGGSVRAAWFIVLVMMLAAAAWSISSKLVGWGMDKWPALALSLMFDLAGLLCAQYARRAIERGTPAGLARLAVLAFVTVSGLLNWSHGQEVGGLVGGVGLASISFAVELLFELHRRDVRDEQRVARGLIAERMPHIPILAWVMFPKQAWKALRSAVRVRLENLDKPAPVTAVTSVDRAVDAPVTPPVTPTVTAPAAPPALPAAPPQAPAPAPQPAPPAPITYSDPRCAVIRGLYDTVPPSRPGTKAMKEALLAAGFEAPGSDGIIRGTLRNEVEAHEPHLADLPAAPFSIGA
ncbi:DUF2637 domain-containing protein [Streptomyces sp. NPDC102279]|uniref:DUF2637 domain-containing protein n=1 Tax=Streptomyces sp. NPDC102279 TaxID=3366153 RepID=UPI00382567F7